MYEGHDGIRAFYAEVLDIWESFSWEPIEMHEFDNLVVAVPHSMGKERGSGLELDRSAMLWRLDQGRGLSLTFYRDPDEGASWRKEAVPSASARVRMTAGWYQRVIDISLRA